MEQQKSNTAVIVASVVVLAVVAFGAYYSMKKPTSSVEVTTQPQAQETTGTPTAAPVVAGYKDGSYTASASYAIPEDGKTESISVTLTLKDGVVTESVLTQNAADKTSKMYQSMFADEYKPMVVGKKIDEVKLDKVSGSSLTPMGFNQAVETIKTQAKA